MKDRTPFPIRSCPACDSPTKEMLFELAPEQFCSANWTYRENYRELLSLSDDARFPVDRCRACGFVYARLLPSEEFLSVVYDRVIAPDLCADGSENKQSYARRMQYVAMLLLLAPERNPLRALDFGCGLGVTLRFLQMAGVDAVGYEPSRDRANRVGEAGFNVASECDEIIGPFDLIVCDNVLEHVPKPLDTLRFFASLSRPGTVLYVSVPNYEPSFVEQQRDAWRSSRRLDMSLNPWEHLNYFSLTHLDQMLSRSGFDAIVPPDLPGHVDIDLRPERRFAPRIANGIASTVRLLRYVWRHQSHRTVNQVFYRYSGGCAPA